MPRDCGIGEGCREACASRRVDLVELERADGTELSHEESIPGARLEHDIVAAGRREQHGDRGEVERRRVRHPLLGDPANRWKDWFEHFGGQPPARYVAQFDDTETLHQAAAQGVGVALARWTLAEPLVKAGRLVTLTKKRLQADFAHYLVYPERSLGHPGFRKVRAWLLEQAGVAVER